MSLGFSRPGLSLVLAAFAASYLPVSHAFAQGKPQPRRSIELSETNSAQILTDLNQLATRKDEFRQLDEQLRALKGLSTPKSMDPGFSVPYITPTVLPNKLIKQLLDRKKNWDLSAEDLNPAARSSDADVSSFEGTDKVDGKTSSLEQFYNALGGQSPGAANSRRSTDIYRGADSNKRSIFSQDNNSEDHSRLPPEIRDKTEKVRDVVNEDPGSIFNPTRPRSNFANFANFFGKPASTTASTAETGMGQKTPMDSFLEEFKKELDTSAAAGIDPALSALVPPTDSGQKTFFSETPKLPSSTSRRDENGPTPAQVNSVLDVTSVSDINSAVVNGWNPLYSPPKVQLPKITPPTPPNLDFPRRKF